METKELKNSTLNTYSFGVIPSSMMASMASQYYSVFLTDVAMMPPALAGTIMLISRIINIFATPVAGATIEKTNLKWGKYRSYILLCAPFSVIFFILMFLNLNISMGAKMVYLIVMYVIGHLFVAFPGAAMAAMFPVLGATPENRVRLATRRAMGMSSGQIMFGFVGMPMMVFFGYTTGNDARGVLLPVIIYAALALAAYYAIAHVLKPYDSGQEYAGRPTTSIMDMLRLAVTNKPLLLLLVVECMRWTSRFVLSMLAAYNFRYVFEAPLMIATMWTVGNIVSLTFTGLSQPFALKFGRKNTYMIGVAFQCVCMFLAWLIARNNMLLYVILIIASHIGYGPSATQTTAFFADAADYAELTSGKSVKGLIMGLQMLPAQFGIAVSGAIAGYGLAIIGYDAAVAPTASVLSGISVIATMIPAVFLVLALIGIKFYTLNDKKIQELRQQASV